MTVHEHEAATEAELGALAGDAQRYLTLSAEMLRLHVPEFDQVSFAVFDDAGGLRTYAQVGDLAADLDRLQYDLGEGPCIDSLREIHAVVAHDLDRDERWRRYATSAAASGVRSQISTPLLWRESDLLGALNMYSTTRADVAPTALLAVQAFAVQIAGTLASFREIGQLHRALDTRKTIALAMGLLMAQHQLTESAAFDVLRRRSSLANVKLRDIAAHMTVEAERAGLALPPVAEC